MKGSSLTTFLMFLPLVAIPLLAIFGIPEFSPVKASPGSPRNEVVVKGISGEPKSNSGNVHSDFAPYPDGKPDAAPHGMKNDPFLFPAGEKSDPVPNSNRMGPYTIAPKRNDGQSRTGTEMNTDTAKNLSGRNSIDALDEIANKKLARSNAASNGQFAVSSGVDAKPVSGQAITWPDAIQRLKQLGITEYVLQPGSQPEACHFSCLYRSPNNPRVTRRFEAEETSPLKAVTNVLAQLQPRP